MKPAKCCMHERACCCSVDDPSFCSLRRVCVFTHLPDTAGVSKPRAILTSSRRGAVLLSCGRFLLAYSLTARSTTLYTLYSIHTIFVISIQGNARPVGARFSVRDADLARHFAVAPD